MLIHASVAAAHHAKESRMRIALPLVVLSLMVIGGCTTTESKTTPEAPSPAKDTHFVPPPKDLMQRATPSKELAPGETSPAAAPAAAKPVKPQ
jgi:hypothetical protein